MRFMKIYYLPNISNEWNLQDKTLLNYVSVQRQKKIAKFHTALDKKLSLYASLLVRMEISLATGASVSNLQFSLDSNNKPILVSYPNINFNFSHTHNAILCGIACNNSIGVDIEKINTPPLTIMNKVFHPQEIEYVSQKDIIQKQIRFYEIWTRKEAFAKQLGIGLTTQINKYNTIGEPISSLLNTWQIDEYCCSVSCEKQCLYTMHTINEKSIYEFYFS